MRATPAARLLVLAIACAGATACKVQQSWKEPEPSLSRMQQQLRIDPFQKSEWYDNGLSMRRPPPGTISVEHTVRPRIVVDGVVDGVYAPQIPVPLTRALVEVGRAKYDVICAACHGVLGTGESVVAQNMAVRRPTSLHEPYVRALPPGRIYQVIRTGYGVMPPYGPWLTVEERWGIVAYVRALQLSQQVEVATLPADVRSALEEATR
jgi:mono/diheme cytochrome c family protein